MLMASITLATTALVAAQVDVRSATNCPSSKDIAERLRPLLPGAAAPATAPDVATVDMSGSAGDMHWRIHLVRANGSEVGDRRIVLQGDCADAATTIATVIAAWETEPFVTGDSVLPVPATKMISTSHTPSTWQLLVGAGGGVGLVGGAAGVGRMEVAGGRRSSRLQGRVGVAAATNRTASLSSGNVDWRHTTFEAGLLLRTLHPVWTLSADAGLVIGWATLQGQGFSQNRRSLSLEYGAVAAVRLGWRLGRFSAWAESRAYGFAKGQRASLPGEGASTNLPLADVTLAVGVSAMLF